MTFADATNQVPREPAVRRAWVIFQLRLKGLSLRRIASQEGVSHQAVSSALLMPNSRIEPAIARALGISVRELFPERFDPQGNRLPQTRVAQRSTLARGKTRGAA